MTERNSELFYAVAEQIRNKPESHAQWTWVQTPFPPTDTPSDESSSHACGTRACIAGWAVLLSDLLGDRVVRVKETWDSSTRRPGSVGEYYYIDTKKPRPQLEALPTWSHPLRRRYELADFDELGQELLGLDDAETTELFHSDWEPPEHMTVPEALEKLAAGADIKDVTA